MSSQLKLYCEELGCRCEELGCRCEELGCRSKKTTKIAEEIIITLVWSHWGK